MFGSVLVESFGLNVLEFCNLITDYNLFNNLELTGTRLVTLIGNFKYPFATLQSMYSSINKSSWHIQLQLY